MFSQQLLYFFCIFLLFRYLYCYYYYIYTTCLQRLKFHLCRKMYCITLPPSLVNVLHTHTHVNVIECRRMHLFAIIFTRFYDCRFVHDYCSIADFAASFLLCFACCCHIYMYVFDMWMLPLAPYRHNNLTVSATCGHKYNVIFLCLLCAEFWKAKSGLFLLFLFYV